MSLIRHVSGISENGLRAQLTSSFDYPALPDVSQRFAVHRGTHAGHISPWTLKHKGESELPMILEFIVLPSSAGRLRPPGAAVPFG